MIKPPSSPILSFSADKIKVNGPKIDGGYSVTFDVGEFEQSNVAKLFSIPQQTIVKVSIDVDE